MRIKQLYEAICNATEMSDEDKAQLRTTLETCSEKTFLELEAIYIYGLY